MGSESDEALYRVVLLNEYAPQQDVEVIRQNVCARFNLDKKVADHVFAGRPVVVKSKTSANKAIKFKMALDELGASSLVGLVPEIDDTDGSGYLERRHQEQRKQIDRRNKVRNGQIIPDRRTGDRRTQS